MSESVLALALTCAQGGHWHHTLKFYDKGRFLRDGPEAVRGVDRSC